MLSRLQCHKGLGAAKSVRNDKTYSKVNKASNHIIKPTAIIMFSYVLFTQFKLQICCVFL